MVTENPMTHRIAGPGPSTAVLARMLFFTGVLALLLSAVASETAQAQNPAPCQKALAEANDHFLFGRFDEAGTLLEDCLKLNGFSNEEKPEVYKLLVQIYDARGLEEQVKKALGDLLTLVPNYEPDPEDPPSFKQMVEAHKREMAAAAVPEETPVEEEQQAPPAPPVFVAEKKIIIYGQTFSEGDIHSNDKIEFKKGNPSTHTGTLTAVHKIQIEKNQTIDGDATAPTVAVKARATVRGTVIEGPVAPMPLPTLSFTAGRTNVTVNADQTIVLAPGSYGNVKVKDRASLGLRTGVYFFKKLELEKEATLFVDLAAGAVEVNVVKTVKLDKKAAVVLVSAGAADSRLFTIHSLHKLIELKQESVFLGTIIAPKAKVVIEKNAFFKGAICAQEIDVKQNVTFMPHGRSVPPLAAASVLADETGGRTRRC